MRTFSVLFLAALLVQLRAEDDEDDIDVGLEEEDHLASAVAAEPEEADETQDVVELTANTFQKFLDKHERVLVDFYAPWCNHCKQLEKEMLVAATKLKAQGLSTKLAKMDTVKHTAMANHIISGYPTLKLWAPQAAEKPKDWNTEEDGEWSAPAAEPVHIKDGIYNQKREYSGDLLAKFLMRQEYNVPRPIEEKDIDSTLSALKSENATFAFVAKVKKNSARATAFYRVAKEFENVNFTHVSIRFYVVWLPKGADAKKDASLFMYRPGFEKPDATKLDYKGAWTGANIAKWGQINVAATVNYFWIDSLWNQDFAELLNVEGIVTAVLDSSSVDLKPRLKEQMVALKGKQSRTNFFLLNKEDLDDAALKHFNPQGLPAPWLTFLGRKKFVVHGRDVLAKADSIAQFQADVKKNKLKRVLKSADEPAKPTDNDGITTLVASTYDKYTLDPKKAVIVDFWTKDCKHCTDLDPIWKKLARHNKEKMKSAAVVAKINTEENEVEEDFTLVPHIVLYPRVPADQKKKAKIVYSGKRDYDAIMEFLIDNEAGPTEEDEL